jgi:hypothetical protein
MLNSPRRYLLPPWPIALPAIPIAADSAQAGVRYYMLIFGAQTHPKIPRFWLQAALGLNCYPIRHRPTPRGVVFRP